MPTVSLSDILRWQDVSQPASDVASNVGATEAQTLFGALESVCAAVDLFASRADGGGAAFRLPLRRADEVANGLGAEITIADAERMLSEWVRALESGRVLLFLSSIARVSIWRWRVDQPSPERVSEVHKTVHEQEAGTPFTRLPVTLPEDACASYAALQRHLLKLTPSARQQLSKKHRSLVAVVATRHDGITTETSWLVYQRFDADTAQVREAIQDGSPVVPVIGLALPMDFDHLATELNGGASCFLPIGDLQTGLPIHVNACFNVLKNRRDIWLPSPSLGRMGDQHVRWAKWNDTLLRHALPRLWMEALRDFVQLDAVKPEHILARLPNLASVSANWKPCAVALYSLVSDTRILPHLANGDRVSSGSSCVLALPTKAFCAHRETLQQLYEATHPQGFARHVVFVPAHIEQAMQQHSGLIQISVETFIEKLLEKANGSQLSPILLALAELADRWSPAQKQGWKNKLATIKWVPLHNGCYATPGDAFAPGQQHLTVADLTVVVQNTANLTLAGTQHAAVLRTALAWGVKAELGWTDARTEAAEIARHEDIGHATRLLDYLEARHTGQSVLLGDKKAALSYLDRVPILPAYTATPDPRSAQSIKLLPPSQVLATHEKAAAWAVQPTAQKTYSFGITCMPLSMTHIVDQIRVLANSSEDVSHHLLKACERLKPAIDQHGVVDVRTALTPLKAVAWLPTSNGRRSPHEVVMESSFDLSPMFCKPLDSWLVLGTEFLQASGVDMRLSGDRLVEALTAIQQRSQGALGQHLGKDDERQVINLMRELAERASADDVLQLKLRQDGCSVLTKMGTLRRNSETFLDDAQWSVGNTSAEVLHGRVGNEEGRVLGCTSVRDELARRCEDEGDDFEEAFGQCEVLADRISGLLHDYNRPCDVLTEHWQNSDDAGAESLMFMLDLTSYPTTSLVDHRAAGLQGPALILASSKPLSDNDIKRIQALGNSHKCKDFSSVGRFGVGINTIYHVSDTPVLRANGALHVFDPLQKVVAADNKTGKKFAISKLESEGFSDMLAPFAHLQGWPTIFRLPLRRRPSAGWKHALSVWSDAGQDRCIKQLIEDFSSPLNIEERLVFSKHVRSVEFCTMDDADKKPFAQFLLEQLTPAHTFMQNLPKSLSQVQALSSSPQHVVAEIRITSTPRQNSATGQSCWVVSHALEADSTLMSLVEDKYDDGVALLPHGAAALRLDAPRDYHGHWCCQLPLSELPVGLPLMLHGFFDLSSSRKMVPLPSQSETSPSRQTQWNQQLLQGPVASSLRQMIEAVRSKVNCANGLSLGSFFELMDLGKGEDKAAAPLRELAREALLRQLLTCNEIFPVITNSASNGSSAKKRIKTWCRGPSLMLHAPNLSAQAHDFLVSCGMNLIKLRDSLVSGLQMAAESQRLQGPVPLTPADVCDYLRGVNLDDHEWDHAIVNELLTFVVGRDGAEPPDLAPLLEVPLLILHSGELRAFDGNAECFVDWHELLPHEPGLFMDQTQFQILLDSYPQSREAVLQAAAAINVRSLTPSDLLDHPELQHSTPHRTDLAWLSAFWRLVWQHKNGLDFAPPAFAGFSNWDVVKVFTPDATTPQVIQLSSLPSSCFSVHDTDASWRKEVADILRECGYNILHPDHVNDENQLQLLQPHISSGDVGFCRLLHDARDTFGTNDGATKHRLDILNFLASRRSEFFNPPFIQDMIRVLRLFLVSSQRGTSRYIDLTDRSKTFVCLRKDPTARYDRVPSMMALDLPELNVGFLSVPPGDCAMLYERLGVQTNLLTSDFVVKFICPALAKAAQRGVGVSVLKPMLDVVHGWWDRNEDETLRTKVKDAVKEVAFIIPSSGGAPVKASKLIDPKQKLAMVFEEVLGDTVPCADMEAYLPLLKRLGMLSFLPGYLVERCARVLDCSAEALNDGGMLHESTQLQALLLMDALLYGFKDVLESRKKEKEPGQKPKLCAEKVVDIEKHLMAAARMRIALVHPPSYGGDASQFADTLAKTSDVWSRPPAQHLRLQLSSVHNLILTSDTEAICWTEHKILARRAELSELNALITGFSDELARALSCYCHPSHLPPEALTNHLLRLSSIPELKSFRLYTHLAKEFESIFKVLDGRASEIKAADVQILTHTACVPLRIDRDASGKLDSGLAKVVLTVPSKCFFTLPRDAECEMRDYVHLWPGANSISPLRSCLEVAKTLGVRQELEPGDMVKYIDAIATLAVGNSLDPQEERAAAFALQSLLGFCVQTPPVEPYPLWLFVQEEGASRLVKADTLVWLDRVDLEHRCDNLNSQFGFRFMSNRLPSNQTGKPNSLDCELLCKVSALRPLSSLLTEELLNVPDRHNEAPGQGELSFEALLTSHEFADASRACLTLSAEESAAHDQMLAKIEIRWTPSQLQSVLYANADCPAERVCLAGSEAGTFSFADGSTLWLQSGILGTRELESSLFDQLASSLVKILRGAKVPATPHGHFSSIFECYTQGPAAIAAALKRRGVLVDMMTVWKREPGVALDVVDHEHLQHSMDFTFDADELVAVSTGVDEHNVSQYKYARVLPYAESSSGQSSLLAIYRLDEGPEAREVCRPHLELYKLQRTRPPAPLPAMPKMVLDISDANCSSELPSLSESEAAEFARLVRTLREMESMDDAQYRKAMKRLWLQWHPDKNPQRVQMATRFIIIIKRHEESFRGGSSFSWLGEENVQEEGGVAEQQGGDEDAAAASAAYSAYPRPRSWADEFEEEQRATESAAAAQRERVQERRRAAASNASSRGGYQGFAGHQREKDNGKADAYWSSATDQLQGCRALLAAAIHGGPETAGLYPQAVYHAQQAGEMAIKSLMFRTCGITQEELKGRGAHDLRLLVSRITESGQWDCPVLGDELSFLAAANTASRYPLNDMRLTPRDKYGRAEAEDSLRIATRLREWAAMTYAVPTPRSAHGQAMGEEQAMPARPPLSLDPAPLPVPPATSAPPPAFSAPPVPPPIEPQPQPVPRDLEPPLPRWALPSAPPLEIRQVRVGAGAAGPSRSEDEVRRSPPPSPKRFAQEDPQEPGSPRAVDPAGEP